MAITAAGLHGREVLVVNVKCQMSKLSCIHCNSMKEVLQIHHALSIVISGYLRRTMLYTCIQRFVHTLVDDGGEMQYTVLIHIVTAQQHMRYNTQTFVTLPR